MRILTLLNKCYGYLGKYKAGLWEITVLKVILLVNSLVIAYSISKIIALISYLDIENVKRYIFMLVFAYGISMIGQYMQFSIRQKVEKNSRTEIKKKILRDIMDSYLVVQRQGVGYHSAKINEILYTDVNQITVLLFTCLDLCIGCVTIALTGFFLFSINYCLAFILTIIFVLSAVFVYFYSKRLRQINVELREETDQHFKLARDVLKNMKFICLSASGRFHYRKYADNLESVKQATIERDRKAWLLGYLSTIFEDSWIIIFLCYSVYHMFTGCFDVSDFMLFFSYSRIYSSGITGLLNQYSGFQQVTVSIERVVELLDIYQPSGEQLAEFPGELREITISDVSFGYGEKKVIASLNKKICLRSILITGKNGKGKTTLLNLLAGGLLPQRGKILYDNIPIENISIESLQNAVAYAPQGDVIFDMSIKDNLLSFTGHETVTEEEVLEICRNVGILEDILSLEKKFETQINEIRDFSFGQKKKILLARACLKPSKVILFDEPLEGLDVESQKLVVSLIYKMTFSKYVFISTHKPERFRFCEETIFL